MKEKTKDIFLICFLVVEAFLYYQILFPSFLNVRYSCFFSIVICFLFALINFKKEKYAIICIIAMFFTLIADLLLVYLGAEQKLIAMISFSLVQISYFIITLLIAKNKKEILANTITRSALVVVAEVITIVVLGANVDILSLVSMFYFSNLICNIIFAFLHVKQNWLLAVGLLLFTGCDIVIGLEFICIYLSVPTTSIIYKISHASFNIAWLFYLPSQVMLAIQIYWQNKNEIKKKGI